MFDSFRLSPHMLRASSVCIPNTSVPNSPAQHTLLAVRNSVGCCGSTAMSLMLLPCPVKDCKGWERRTGEEHRERGEQVLSLGVEGG